MELLAHSQNPHSRSNLPEFGQKIAYRANRTGVAEAFAAPHVRKTVEVALHSLDFCDRRLTDLARHSTRTAKEHNPHSFYLLRSLPGVGTILALVLRYEIHAIARFPRAQAFVAYARRVRCPQESAGNRYGAVNKTLGNVHLQWAFSEAACLFLRNNEPVQRDPQPPGQSARQRESAGDPRPQLGPRRLLQAQTTGGVRSETRRERSLLPWGWLGEPGGYLERQGAQPAPGARKPPTTRVRRRPRSRP